MPKWERRGSGLFVPDKPVDSWREYDGPDPNYHYFEDDAGGSLKVRKVGGGDAASASVVYVALNGAGPTVGATAAEVDLLPAQAIRLIDGMSFWYPGKSVRITCAGNIATGAAPGNASLRIRYAASATTGVILADTGAIAMTASIAGPFIWRFEVTLTFRGPNSTAAPLFALGFGSGLTSVTPPAQFHMGSAGPTIPAAVNIDTTVGTNALRPTLLTSAAVAATAYICHVCVIEALN